MAPKDPSFASQSIYPLTLLYDGESDELCREIDNLRAADVSNRLLFIDVTGREFSSEQFGKPLVDLRNELHAVRPDGRFIRGESVWRLAYAAVGRGWMFAPARWQLLRPLTRRVQWVLSQHRYLLAPRRRPWLSVLRQIPPARVPMNAPVAKPVQDPQVDASLALLCEMSVLSDAVGASAPQSVRGPVGGWQDTLPLVNAPAEIA